MKSGAETDRLMIVDGRERMSTSSVLLFILVSVLPARKGMLRGMPLGDYWHPSVLRRVYQRPGGWSILMFRFVPMGQFKVYEMKPMCRASQYDGFQRQEKCTAQVQRKG